eukprot:3664153-Alexandrium_andersonii.AAC.1
MPSSSSDVLASELHSARSLLYGTHSNDPSRSERLLVCLFALARSDSRPHRASPGAPQCLNHFNVVVASSLLARTP